MSRFNDTDYPKIDPTEIGKLPNIGYGSLERVRAHNIVAGAVALLSADITAIATTFDVDKVGQFPATPFTIQIQEERMRVTDITSLTLTVTRGYDSTEPATHKQNKTVYEVLTSYIYMVADHAVKAINNVYVDGELQISRFTAYTGQSGDEHATYPGRAVIEFNAEAHISPQFNIESSAEKEQGTFVRVILPEISSHKIIPYQRNFAGNSNVIISSGETVMVQFPAGHGSIIKQEYNISIRAADNIVDDELVVSAAVTESGILKAYTGTADYDGFSLYFSRDGGIWNDVLKITCQGKDMSVRSISKDVTKKNERLLEGSDANTASYVPAIIAKKFVSTLGSDIYQPSFVWYSNEPPRADAVIVSQTHYAFIDFPGLPSTAQARISAVDPDTNIVLAFRDYEFPPDYNGSGVMQVSHNGGDWNTVTKVTYNDDLITELDDLYKQVFYATDEIIGAAVYNTTSSARVVVGNVIDVDVDLALDETGDYGGVGSLIDRPDWILKHILVTEKGYALAEIDSTSFTTAGSFYDSNSYIMAGLLTTQKLSDLAFECRSILRSNDGKWELDVIPDAAPSEDKIIDEGEIVGQYSLFTYEKSLPVDIQNDITALYKQNHSKAGEYLSVKNVTDSGSVTKYGTRKKEYKFSFLRDVATLTSVLNHILLENKVPLLTVAFDIPYEHSGLRVGDTIKLTDATLWNDKKYFIETIHKTSPYINQITGREWW